jgi:hypothetical protein
VNVFEEFYKPFIHNLFAFFRGIGIPVTDLYGKATEQVIQLLLTVAIIFATAIQ